MVKKKIFSIILIVVAVLVIGVVVWVRFVDVGEIEFIKNSDSPIADVVCSYPMRISGDSMEPVYESGETVVFDKCFDLDDLKVGMAVTYKTDSSLRIVVIRDIDGDQLDVSNEARADDINTINFSDLVAISKE
jgi:hypothetical protein